MRLSFDGLWKHPDFLKLWSGETVSLFGSQISTLALPLTAAITFQATPIQIGILQAADFAPFLLFTLFIGVWVDHHQRRPILILSNLGRAILLGMVPLCAFLHILRTSYLYLIAFLVGVLTVFFQLAHQSYLPTLVKRDQLTEGNSKLTISESLAEVAGPGLGGALIQILSAPFAILLDVVSFLFSAMTLSLIRTHEEPVLPSQVRHNIWQEIKEGLHIVFSNPYLRALGGEAATFNLFYNAIETASILFVLHELHATPGMYGLILAVGSLGSLLGALLAAPAGRRWGVGPTLIGVQTIACLLPLLIPLANGPIFGTCWLATIGFFLSMGVTISNVHVTSFRQAVTPRWLLGRMTASYRFFTWGPVPLGHLLGGLLGSLIGVRMTVFVCALGVATACLWIVFSPIAKLRHLSEYAHGEEDPSPFTGEQNEAQVTLRKGATNGEEQNRENGVSPYLMER